MSKIFIADIDSEGNVIPDTYLSGDTYEELTFLLENDLRLTSTPEFQDAVMLAWTMGFDPRGFEFSVGNGNGCLVRFTYVPADMTVGEYSFG